MELGWKMIKLIKRLKSKHYRVCVKVMKGGVKEIKCPFCGATAHIKIKKKDEFLFPHPPDPFIHKGEERKLSKKMVRVLETKTL